MPKERRTRPLYFDRLHPPPNPLSSPCRQHLSLRNPPETPAKEWDDIRCPVCMEHPHNAVLLLCSSAGKGCRPFMCNTSSRHSNCHDQYRKSLSEPSCPLCRGRVTGSTVVDSARRYMNAKVRSCSKESCGFSGTYGELRKHARREHPFVRPSVADPERQREWRMLEQQREFGDLLSTMQPAMGGQDWGLTVPEGLEPDMTLFVTSAVYVWGVPSSGGANDSAGGDNEDGSSNGGSGAAPADYGRSLGMGNIDFDFDDDDDDDFHELIMSRFT